MHAVGPASVRQVADRVADVVDGRDVERLDAVPRRHREALGDEIEADDPAGAAVQRHATRHLADRAEPEHHQRPARRDGCVLDSLPGGREHVREVDEAFVRRPLRDLDRAELRLRHAQQLGLAPGYLPVQLRVAEERRPLAMLAHLRRLALGVELHVAHEAVTARDVERHDDAIAGPICVTSGPTSSTMPIGS